MQFLVHCQNGSSSKSSTVTSEAEPIFRRVPRARGKFGVSSVVDFECCFVGVFLAGTARLGTLRSFTSSAWSQQGTLVVELLLGFATDTAGGILVAVLHDSLEGDRFGEINWSDAEGVGEISTSVAESSSVGIHKENEYRYTKYDALDNRQCD